MSPRDRLRARNACAFVSLFFFVCTGATGLAGCSSSKSGGPSTSENGSGNHAPDAQSDGSSGLGFGDGGPASGDAAIPEGGAAVVAEGGGAAEASANQDAAGSSDAAAQGSADAGADGGVRDIGSCCSAQSTPGCEDPNLELCVCQKDPACCTTAWSLGCALIVQEKYCQSGVRDCVCGTDAGEWAQTSCCSTDWTSTCDSVATLKCGAAQGCL